MQIAASSVEDYLSRAPAEHRKALARVRDVVRRNLPAGYEEGLLYGAISWYVPPERLGHTYNGQPLGIIGLASQKNYMALYLMSVYGDPELSAWFTDAFATAGKKLDMGKSCLRFRTLSDLPLDVIGEVASRVPVDAFVATYERAQVGRKQKPVVIAGRPGGGAVKSGTKTASKAGASSKAAAGKSTAKATAKAKPAASKAKPAASKAKPAARTKPAAKSKPVASKTKAATTKARSSAKTKPSPRRGR